MGFSKVGAQAGASEESTYSLGQTWTVHLMLEEGRCNTDKLCHQETPRTNLWGVATGGWG